MDNVPEQYQPSANLQIRFTKEYGSHPLTVTILHAFTPFTINQILLVKPVDTPPSSLSTHSSPFVLKVYDPRYFPDRHKRKTPKPWTLAAETTAAQIRGGRGRDPNFAAYHCPSTDDKPGWEEWYFQQAEKQVYAETTAYAKLISLQGTRIPRVLGAGTLELADRAISQHVLLLEYIPDARRLDTVDPTVVPKQLALDVVETVRLFNELGVIHTDVNPGNVLFTPGDRPTRAVMIDFGSSGIREEGLTDEDWQNDLDCDGDLYYIKKWLESFLKIDLDT